MNTINGLEDKPMHHEYVFNVNHTNTISNNNYNPLLSNTLHYKYPGRVNIDGKSPTMSLKLVDKRNNSSLKYYAPMTSSLNASPSGRKFD